MTDRNEPTGRMDGAHSATTPDISPAALEALAAKLERAHLEYSDGFPCGFGPPINPDGPEAAATLRALADQRELPADVAFVRAARFARTCAETGISSGHLSRIIAVMEFEVEKEKAKPAHAQPPADVAALVEEARRWEAALTARADRIGEGLKRPGVVDRFEEEVHHEELATSAHLIDRLAVALTAQARRIKELEAEPAVAEFVAASFGEWAKSWGWSDFDESAYRETLRALTPESRAIAIGKHEASSTHTKARVIRKLDAAGLYEAADVLRWSMWWAILQDQRERFVTDDLKEARDAALARAERAEALNREAASVLEPFAREFGLTYQSGEAKIVLLFLEDDQRDPGLLLRDFRAVRALAAKLKGEADERLATD